MTENAEGRVGIICGSGFYPKIAAAACIEKGLDFCLIFINGISSYQDFFFADDSVVMDPISVKHTTLHLGEIGTAINFFQSNNVKQIIFSGAVKRPDLRQLKLDSKGKQWLAYLGAKIFGGDDCLLHALSELVESEGFKIISGTELIDKNKIFLSEGTHSRQFPSKNDLHDIEIGIKAAKTIGALDIGQSVVVHDGLILGVECIEGTNELIKRCAALRKTERGGVLVKMSKPQQDVRVDLPTIGPETINLLSEKHFAGLAVEAEKCIVVDKRVVIEKVNNASLFLRGVAA